MQRKLKPGTDCYVLMDEAGIRVLPGVVVRHTPCEDGRNYYAVRLLMGEEIRVRREDILVQA